MIPQGGGGVVPGRSGSGGQQAMRARTFSAYKVCHVTITFLKIILTFGFIRRKIRLIESNAKCCYLKN